MTEKRWEFELDGVKHIVELEHSPISNKRSIRVDGRLLPMPPESQQPKERSGKHAFRVSGHPCEIHLKYANRKFDYNLVLDGVRQTPVSSESVESPLGKETPGSIWAAVGFMVLLGLGGNWFNWHSLHTSGYYYPELAFLTPVLTVMGISLMLFPKEFIAHRTGKMSGPMWATYAIALLLAFANNFALGHGLY
jgi:hypothetical protein